MYPPYHPSPLVDLRIPPREGVVRRPHPKHPHPARVVAMVRRLVETTCEPQHVIALTAGVDKGTVSRWMNKHGWKRPEGAAPSYRHVNKKLAAPLPSSADLARRLRVQAERLIAEIESAPAVDPAAVAEALVLLDRVREAQKVRHPQKPHTPARPPWIAPKPGKTRLTRDERRAAVLRGWNKRYRRVHEHEAMLRRETPETAPAEAPRPEPRIRSVAPDVPPYGTDR
jgi:hypothetical protein